MKHLIIYSHPNPKSFNHAILETYEVALKEAGHEVRVRDLYADAFDPVSAEPVVEQCGALQGLGRNNFAPGEFLFQIIAGPKGSAGPGG